MPYKLKRCAKCGVARRFMVTPKLIEQAKGGCVEYDLKRICMACFADHFKILDRKKHTHITADVEES